MVARVLDLEIVEVQTDVRGRLTGANLEEALSPTERDVCAVVATGGITNVGIVDDLEGAAIVAAAHDLWFHVDAAYGGAALLVEESKPLFAGIERADSVVIDPHKWLFTPLDCSALLYREPAHARAAFTQHADYIAAFQEVGDWNPGDYGIQLTRRARGLPFWFMLATYGTEAVRAAVGESIRLATDTARLIEAWPDLTLLMEPELSVVVFTRAGWSMADYQRWSDRLLAEGTAFVLPTIVDGEPCLRFCFVNPRTTLDDVRAILRTLSEP
jgi:glutamate/tyrosine decarboxylase-like PLP-dependent enzyme